MITAKLSKKGPEGPSEIVPQPLGQSHSPHPINTTQETSHVKPRRSIHG